ncbi:unnamed protein product, partial [Brassica oleracea]
RVIWPELPEVDAAEKAIEVELSEKVDQSIHQHRRHQSLAGAIYIKGVAVTKYKR